MTWMPLGTERTCNALVMFSYLKFLYESQATWGDAVAKYSLYMQEFVNDLDAPGFCQKR
jgi:hypothetical protein